MAENERSNMSDHQAAVTAANAHTASDVKDLVSLDACLDSSRDSSAGTNSQDSILDAADIFQTQLDQMTQWKRQLAQQMDAMRHDGFKLLERQKALALEKKKLGDERSQIATEREQVHKQQSETQEALTHLTVERESLEKLRHEVELRQAELNNQQKGLAEQEARRLSEDVRLREGLEQLEEQRKLLAEANRRAVQEKEAADARAHELAAREETLARQAQALAAREEQVRAAQQQNEQSQTSLKSQADDLAKRERELADTTQAIEGDLRARLAAVETSERTLSGEKETLAQQRRELKKKLEAMEREQAEGFEALAKQTKRLSERRAEVEAAETNVEGALASRIAKATESLKKELKSAKERYSGLESAKDELEFQLELRKEDTARQLDSLREELSKEIAQRDREIADWKKKYETALKAATENPAGATGNGPVDVQIAKQLDMLEKQRDELASQLISIQDSLRLQQEEALLERNVLEGKALSLEQRNSILEAERATWKQQAIQRTASEPVPDGQSSPPSPQTVFHRERLLRQAKALRNFRQQIRDTQTLLESSRAEIAQQREQIRARKENLEQVKRLLEKQEMVMARKLADHNAIKTVAAVGTFLIMILGSSFFGVYRFVKPVYRSEAVVQLAPAANVEGAELNAWLNQQMSFIRTNEVAYAAWKVLRTPEEHYAMHDVRDEWLASLGKQLNLQLDAGAKTLSIQYSGSDSEGVSQVCNALATAYAMPGMRESTDSTKTLGLGAQVLAKATAPLYPSQDSRLTISLCVVASAFFVSLLLVMVFRHFVARQLKEIDQMADAEDLENVQTELSESPRPEVA